MALQDLNRSCWDPTVIVRCLTWLEAEVCLFQWERHSTLFPHGQMTMKFCLEAFFCVKTYSVLLAGDFRAPHDQHRANLELKWQRHRDYRDGMWHYRAFLNIPYTSSSHLVGPKFPLEAELTPELMGVMAGSDAEVMQAQHRSEATRWHSVISRNKQLNMKVILKIFCFRNGFQFVFVFF